MKKRVIKLKNKRYKTILSDYRQHVHILGYSENGQEVKYANVLELLTWLESEGIQELTAVEPVHIKAYHEHLRHRPHKKQAGVLHEAPFITICTTCGRSLPGCRKAVSASPTP